MGIKIEFNKDIYINNLKIWADNIAYAKYKEGILDNPENKLNIFDLNANVSALAAFKILNQSLIYTPYDTGNLRNSAYIKPYQEGYEVGYTAEYATLVHEIGVNFHKPPTQYKYLEDAAFEIYNEYKASTGDELNITIEYNPLRVFVGVIDSPGQSLTGIKANEQLLNKPETYQKLLDDFMNFDYDNGSGADRVYYKKMTDFFTYYGNHRHMSTMMILREWIDRQRHK